VDLVAVGHGSARAVLGDERAIVLPHGIPDGAKLISELTLKRVLGLLPPQREENRTFAAEGLATACRVDVDVVHALAAYDVLEPVGEAFGFGDLRTLREAAGLLQSGFALRRIVEASIALRRAGRRLSETRLCAAPWGDIVQQLGSGVARLDGQLTLPLEEDHETVDDVFARAEECELNGDLENAERWYRLACRLDPTDPVPPFNLANVLDGLDRGQEAAFAHEEALARDPAFADAWVNLGILRERADNLAGATACYSRAVAARPDFLEALHNLALLLTRTDAFAEAVPIWERYLASGPDDEARARRLLALCRIGCAPERQACAG
jgi:tetratricopeptide (TPR) repeat protein